MANEDLVSRNAILSGYSQEGNHGLEAIFVFIEMVGEGMGLDHVSFTSAVSACGHEMNLELGKQIHGLTIKSGYGSHVSVWYAQNGLCQDALKTFLVATMESKPDNYTFGSVLSAIGDAQDISLKYGQ
ncbi:hypothetical protein Pyn_00701 [Prunus yedoensis var. nudiflora]|uniref:Pentatricopeptide repeat-containing protein n=1 Tax=Prunus yedoensis var. nudiflora TaxID=2094558 RepID=A0A314YV76_PRUYE|nr:hypothetical protein Pyn_00701 [Prunus yedoensis var. nudiflora]